MTSGKRRRIPPKIVIATPKLLVGRGKPVPEWQRNAANLKELRRKLAETKGAKPVRIPPLELPPEQIVRWPPQILPDHLLVGKAFANAGEHLLLSVIAPAAGTYIYLIDVNPI